MKSLLFGALLTVLAAAGCGKKQAAAPGGNAPAAQTENADAGAAASQDAAAPAAPVSAPAITAPAASINTVQAIDGPVHPFLTSQLRQFVQEKGRLPESFAEFAGARLDSVPRLPQGLMYVIDPTTQEVKVVRKQ